MSIARQLKDLEVARSSVRVGFHQEWNAATSLLASDKITALVLGGNGVIERLQSGYLYVARNQEESCPFLIEDAYEVVDGDKLLLSANFRNFLQSMPPASLRKLKEHAALSSFPMKPLYDLSPLFVGITTQDVYGKEVTSFYSIDKSGYRHLSASPFENRSRTPYVPIDVGAMGDLVCPLLAYSWSRQRVYTCCHRIPRHPSDHPNFCLECKHAWP